ncbi:zinc-finger homeodomain protein 11-like [Phragmites australis]|uniref:zinc-finger homeodomain protein 11-like n=1 Tax=Phragmites australis TaxID=29695 RepID=UPI002D7A37D0|nr:zinc-finger homeodomain protein 11-like [Phragmites australis]
MEQQQQQERAREVYRECMRNHAAKLGTYASDGCCEYTPDDAHPAAMLCAACGCHRNFHRKAFLDAVAGATGAASPHAPPMLPSPGAPPGYGMHMAMASGMGSGDGGAHCGLGSGSRRRTRTKFTEEQKARMARFAERLGWRMPKREPGRAPGDDDVARFCREIGVTRQVFKVWMHNHKAGGASGGVGGGGAAQTSSSTTRGDGGGGHGGSMSPAMGGDGEDDEEVRGSEMCM